VTGESIIALLKELNTERNVTVICVTHDHKMLAASDRICWLKDGQVVRTGTPADLADLAGGH
jgi:putative ABC transport system ATP-binding protein